MTLAGTITPNQSGLGNDGNKAAALLKLHYQIV